MQLFLHSIQNFLAPFQFQLVAHMKGLVAVLLLVAISTAVESNGEDNGGPCKQNALKARPHSVSILEFGAVGDGITLNTVAFENAIFYLKSFADKGGAQLYVPSGTWLTGSFNLTNHLTLFLERGATIIASQDYSHWDIVDFLPSYGRGIGRYRSLIYGQNLSDVVITGDNGTIDGQGSIWWKLFNSNSLNYTRPNLIEFVDSVDVIISNLTFLDSPAWGIHPVYCSNVQIQNITYRAPAEFPYTSGIVPGAGLAFGSEMSGGISVIIAEKLHILNSPIGIELKTTRGRGGYMRGIFISDAELENISLGISMTGYSGFHPDDKYDTSSLPVVGDITFKNVIGANISVAGNFSGIVESPFSTICLSNVTFSLSSEPSPSWFCSNVIGFSEHVIPEPCPDIQSSYSKFPFSCFSSLYPLFNNVSGHLDHQPQEL
uniref:Pectate lyase superfamily protein domain-containing protein n=1 Tax=Glycine max TaxID=3847 RepID=K7MZJ4_SOYBN